jgi:hypothetical protein
MILGDPQVFGGSGSVEEILDRLKGRGDEWAEGALKVRGGGCMVNLIGKERLVVPLALAHHGKEEGRQKTAQELDVRSDFSTRLSCSLCIDKPLMTAMPRCTVSSHSWLFGQALKRASPTSLKVTFKALKDGATQELEEIFLVEYRLSQV